MTIPPVIPARWLLDHLHDPGLRVLDASWYLSSMNRDPRREFREGHIPGAQLFSIDEASDPASPLPHTLPPPAQFADVVSRLGISSADHVVVYDASGTNFSAPRVWWMFRVFGHDAVSLLDGGFGAWKAAGGPIEPGDAVTAARGAFDARLRPAMVRSATQVLEAQRQGRRTGRGHAIARPVRGHRARAAPWCSWRSHTREQEPPLCESRRRPGAPP